MTRGYLKNSKWTIVGLFAFSCAFFVQNSGTTGALFFDEASSSKNTIASGIWIPELSLKISSVDVGDSEKAPCAMLSVSDITKGTVEIYYEFFSNDDDPFSGGVLFDGSCVPIPDGKDVHFQAQAVNVLNDSWKSNLISKTFSNE